MKAVILMEDTYGAPHTDNPNLFIRKNHHAVPDPVFPCKWGKIL